MAEFTPNYRLHQWEPTDPFLREDFNRDFSTIDAALGRAERSAEANAYNVYNLMLQNDYEGKYTGYKKVLLFDGFLDENGIAEKSEALIHTGTQMVLTRQGQGDVDAGYSSEYHSFFTTGSAVRDFTVTAGGLLTGWSIKYYMSSTSNTGTVRYTVSVNGQSVASGSWPESNQDVGVMFRTFTLPQAIPLTKGDQLNVSLVCTNSAFALYRAADGGDIGGVFHFTPRSSSEASLVGADTTLPVRSRICAWVRHNRGTVGVTVLDGDQEYPMSLTGTVETDNLQHEPCTESAFVLEDAPAGPSLALRVELDLDEEADCARLYDYGAVLL